MSSRSRAAARMATADEPFLDFETPYAEDRRCQMLRSNWPGGAALEDVAAAFGVTRERIRQIETAAIRTYVRRLRVALGDDALDALAERFGHSEGDAAELVGAWLAGRGPMRPDHAPRATYSARDIDVPTGAESICAVGQGRRGRLKARVWRWEDGEFYSVGQLAAMPEALEAGVCAATLSRRLAKLGWDVSRAVRTPPRPLRRRGSGE